MTNESDELEAATAEMEDDDLINLLEEVISDSEDKEDEIPEVDQIDEEEIEELMEIASPPGENLPELHIVKPEEVGAEPVTESVVPEVPLPFIELAKKFNDVASKVLQDACTDRAQLDELVKHASNMVIAQDRPQNAMVEAWVAALSKKAETNIALTKLLDSIAKLLAASKNNDVFVQVNNASNDDDLKSLLAQPDATYDGQDI